MRIRKHAKISPLIYATSSLKPGTVLQPHVCQLNQSPWDVMSFSPPSTPPPPPPPACQVDGDDVVAGNGSSVHCVSVVERESNTGRQWEYSDDFTGGATTAAHKMDESKPIENEKITFCVKTDGKSWQCRREAAGGNSLCLHHLSLAKSYHSNYANSSKNIKKSEKPTTTTLEPRRRPRPKKSSISSSSYEFYYYSGFGPRWGKKRGETCKNSDISIPKNNGHHQEHEIEEFDYNYDDYEDEDDDEEDEESRNNGNKKKRKPIKARSLKSLM